MRNVKIVRAWLALAVAGITLAFGVAGAQAAFPGANGRIAFAVTKWRLPDPCPPIPHGCEPEFVSSRIDTVLPNGRGRRVLRAFPAGDNGQESGPTWSPNGRLLTFEQGGQIATIRKDGTGLRRLPRLTNGEAQPTWSPDGRRLAFAGHTACCFWLYTVRPNGTGLRRVIAQEARWPAWSATGTIAFVTFNNTPSDLKNGLYTIRPDGSRLRSLFGRYWGTAYLPDWSPNGRRIAFQARNHIFTLRADGRGLRRLTGPKLASNHNSAPAWSPDGRFITFLRDEDLYVMRADGRRLRRIVNAVQPEDPGRVWEELSPPTWQPLPR
jgi:Tol biopolymer transport system component